jgi:hypothetical protein
MTVPADRLFGFVMERAALRAEAVITILNAPALFIDALLSIFIPRLSDWMSASLLLTWTRHSILYPLYAVIAWVYVGRAFDSLLHRREVRTVNAVLSLILALLVFGSAILLLFGLSTGELQGEGRFYWIISGLALWTVLFSIPFTIWLFRKLKHSRKAI